MSSGEDGNVKIWSRAGYTLTSPLLMFLIRMLRSSLIQSPYPIYSSVWSSDSILYTSNKSLIIKPTSPTTKPTEWYAHDALILSIDWSPKNNLIVSAGEDCKYKVWDKYGKCMYSSTMHEYPLTSVKWGPDGDWFGVGGFGVLRVCDKLGVKRKLFFNINGDSGRIR